MLRMRAIQTSSKRYLSTKPLTSSEIRKLFIDFFINNHAHKFVRSSPVIPFCDPTVAFVNAGMNQFKPIFLGKQAPSSRRVTNHQKCVRVGGKHNDLNTVGKDGYHHTFFEMLGNWSFGDYFKKEACEMALEFLTGPLGISKSRLYVTYFGGDDKLNLPVDSECIDIWRNLGFPKDRIIPFGSVDNFWEMGITGPCGPCTEIHIAHSSNKEFHNAKYVNTGRADLTELWNIVFIQYNRNIDGVLTSLPEKHVDTGMGFERLTAVLQNKSSNYDTDIFAPIFCALHKLCKVPEYSGKFSNTTDKYDLDTSYRIFADHARMITACLSDGMLPDQNQKLRRILRTCFMLADNVFKRERLLNEIVPIVADFLGPAYPEMSQKLNDVLEILNHEEEIFKALRKNSAQDFSEILASNPKLEDVDLMESPGFVPAFKELKQLKDSFENATIPGQFLFKLHDTYGLNDEIIEKIAKIENLNLDTEAMIKEFIKVKQRYKLSLNSAEEIEQKLSESVAKCTKEIPDTDDQYKYIYQFDSKTGKYKIPQLSTKIVGILQNGFEKIEIDLNTHDVFCIITEKTNFYYESGGQQSDRGKIVKQIQNGDEIIFNVLNVSYVNGCVIHTGKFVHCGTNNKINIADIVELNVDNDHRTFNIIHHTATHVLNAGIRNLFKKVTYQVSSAVTADYLKLELGIIGLVINKNDIGAIEDYVRKVIDRNLEMNVQITNSTEIQNDQDIIKVPGEIYPEENLRLLTLEDPSLKFQSKELCCGTHVCQTSEIQNFCITNFKQTSRARYAFTAVAGELARKALENSNEINSIVEKLEKDLKTDCSYDVIEMGLQSVRKQLLHSDITLPYAFRTSCLEKLEQLSRRTVEASRTILKNLVEIEMKNILQEKPPSKHPYIIHFLKTSSFVNSVPLQKATKLCSDRPVLIISCCEGILKARCCVPVDKIKDNFSAQKWLQEFASIFKGEVAPPKGKSSKEVCNMKAKKVFLLTFDEHLEAAIKKAEKFASENL